METEKPKDGGSVPGQVDPVVRGERDARNIVSLTKRALDKARVRGVMDGAKMVIDSLRVVVPHHANALGGLLHIQELFELLDEAEETICGKASNALEYKSDAEVLAGQSHRRSETGQRVPARHAASVGAEH